MHPRRLRYFVLAFACASLLSAQPPTIQTITSDIPRFWRAYDAIAATGDSAEQAQLLERLYLQPGTPGLTAFRAAKGYSAADYLEAIRNYPKFWASVRQNTLRAERMAAKIDEAAAKLVRVYPELKPATAYFTIGALRSGGTTSGDNVLIGAEFALADSSAVTEEFPPRKAAFLRTYFDTNPIENFVFLNVHELVHTQQQNHGYNLLSQSLYEGVAEFVAVEAMKQPSPLPFMNYGTQNDSAIRQAFSAEMFHPYWYEWLYNDEDNRFGIKDLGYYVGYVICSAYVANAPDRRAAIQTLIELDYMDPNEVAEIVNASGYFSGSIATHYRQYRAQQPRVVSMHPFEAGTEEVEPTETAVIVKFSQPMDPRFRGFDVGPAEDAEVLRVQQFLGFSSDSLSATFRVAPEPNRFYQLLLTDGFRDAKGYPLIPFLVEIHTKE